MDGVTVVEELAIRNLDLQSLFCSFGWLFVGLVTVWCMAIALRHRGPGWKMTVVALAVTVICVVGAWSVMGKYNSYSYEYIVDVDESVSMSSFMNEYELLNVLDDGTYRVAIRENQTAEA